MKPNLQQPSPRPPTNFIAHPSPASNLPYNATYSPNISPMDQNYYEPLSNRMLSPMPSVVSPYSNQSTQPTSNYSPARNVLFVAPTGASKPITESVNQPQGQSIINLPKLKDITYTEVMDEALPETKFALTYLGQSLVQDIIHKSSELFQTLKIFQLPTSLNPKLNPQEKIKKSSEIMNNLCAMFSKLDKVYKECNFEPHEIEIHKIFKDFTANSQFTNIDPKLLAEKNSLVEKLKHHNEETHDIISEIRCLIYELNSLCVLEEALK